MKCDGNAIFPSCHFEDNCKEGFRNWKVSFQRIIIVVFVVLCRIIQTNYVS